MDAQSEGQAHSNIPIQLFQSWGIKMVAFIYRSIFKDSHFNTDVKIKAANFVDNGSHFPLPVTFDGLQ